MNEPLTRGGIYLARLDPVKASEVGKIRPVALLNAQMILDVFPPTVFVCPLSSHSKPEFQGFHVHLAARDNLHADSFALTEHCRAISIQRIIHPRLAQLRPPEITSILNRLKRMLDL